MLPAVGLALVLLAEKESQNARHAVLEQYGVSMSSVIRQSMGAEYRSDNCSTNSPEKFMQSRATLQKMADSMASRNIPERLSDGILRVCQNTNGTWHGVYHRLIIELEPALRVISMHGGTIPVK